MITKNIIIAAVSLLLFLYILSKLRKKKTNFDKEYTELLTSNKYKVKGPYD
ncbi:MAG: hypothetical protein AB1571_01675 [Nanoarchaeota archaeon]